jgi:hypothetical protein
MKAIKFDHNLEREEKPYIHLCGYGCDYKDFTIQCSHPHLIVAYLDSLPYTLDLGSENYITLIAYSANLKLEFNKYRGKWITDVGIFSRHNRNGDNRSIGANLKTVQHAFEVIDIISSNYRQFKEFANVKPRSI